MSTSWFGRQTDSESHEGQLWRGRRAVFSRIVQGFEQNIRTIILGLLLVVFLVLLYTFWGRLFFQGDLAPMITVRAEPYHWPLPPNAWAAEDVEGLSFLDGKMIYIVEQPNVVQTKEDFLYLLGNTSILRSRDKRTAVIYYFSLHGAFDGEQPCLIPPAASPLDPSTWIKLSEVLQQINEFADNRNKLVVLDCSRMQTNWHIGLAYNDFSRHLEQWWSENGSQFPTVAILNSTSPGQRSWSSVFGHYFRLGLAGEAATYQAANGDNNVSVSELHQYLQARVSNWAKQNRDVTQVPMLLPAADDFGVAWANKTTVEDLNKSDDPFFRDGQTVDRNARRALWQQLDDVRKFTPYRYEPLAWRNLEHQLMWLEQLSNSGQAYARLATRTAELLRTDLANILTRGQRAEQTRSVRDCCSIISGDNLFIPDALEVHSLPLVEYFQTVGASISATLHNTISQFHSQPSEQLLDETLWRMKQSGVANLVQHQFLYMLQRYQFPGLWQRSAALQQLLQLRDQAEQLAVPGNFGGGDERTHDWVRMHLSIADDLRRHAEDQLFIDGPTQLDNYLQKAGSAYSDSEDVAKKLSQAILLRDQACAEIPYLAQWLTHPLRAKETRETDDAQVEDIVLPVVRETKILGQLIAHHVSPATADQASVQQAIDRIISADSGVRQKLESLRAAFLAECRQLKLSSDRTSEISAAAKIRRIEAALPSPLLSPKMRFDLRQRRSELVGSLANQNGEVGNDATSEPTVAADSQGWAERMGTQILLTLLEVASPHDVASPSDQAPVLDEQTSAPTRWRTGLRQLSQDLKRLSEHYAGLDASTELDERQVRREWNDMERRLRTMAPIWFPDPPRTAKDPIDEIRQLDLATLVLWHGDRSLRDFWGDAGRTSPFFGTVTRGYVGSANRLLPAFRSLGVAALDARLKRHLVAARGYLKTSATDAVLLESDDEVETHIAVEWSAENSPDLPVGTAALLLRNEEKRSVGARFDSGGAVALPGGASDVKMTFGGDGPRLQDSRMRVDAVFRGHEFPGYFRVQNLGGATVSHQPYAYEQSQVTLHSPWKTLSIVFILDCSRSMSTAMDNDGSRLDVAKEALRQLLSSLPARRSVRVGVRFFGHRLGWSTDRPVRILISPSLARDIPDGVYPDGDVEPVLPLTNLDDAVAQRLFQEMDGVIPWGQSPLYLSLTQSVAEDFALEDDETDRHIVVLTDGRNYQFRPTPEDEKHLADVVQAGARLPIPIHVLGLGMDDEEQREVAADFSTIADMTGGIYRNCDSSTNLMEALRSILEPESYSLEDLGTSATEHRSLGLPVDVEAFPEKERLYAVNFRANREEIWLEGGEVLPFYVLPRGLGIYAYAYDHDVARTVPLEGRDRPPVVRFRKPIRTNQQVRFPISLQQQYPRESVGDEDRWQWTRRPSEAWVEITPLSSKQSAAGPTYIFYDANYEPNKPVPELQLVARAWPPEATAARIQMWFKARQTKPTTRTPLATVVDNGVIAPSNVAPGITIQIDASRVNNPAGSYRLRVVERHDDSVSTGIASLKVFPPSGDGVKPARIIRQFDARRGLVVHSFYYEADADLLARLRRSEIGIAPRVEAHRDAWRPAVQAIVVPITETGNFIPLATR